jgi:hypothetical protein
VYDTPLASAVDVTLVAHGSIDRLDVFGKLAGRWEGPKVFVITVIPAHAGSANEQINSLRLASSDWKNVKVMVYLNTGGQFPINALRNIAIDHAPSLYIFPIDVDFIPSEDTYDIIKTDVIPYISVVDRAMAVVPHFETWPCRNTALRADSPAEVLLPVNVDDLFARLEGGTIQPFHAPSNVLSGLESLPEIAKSCRKDNYVWPPGVAETNYGKWYALSKAGKRGFFPLQIDRTVGGPKWEPFLVVRRIEADGVGGVMFFLIFLPLYLYTVFSD